MLNGQPCDYYLRDTDGSGTTYVHCRNQTPPKIKHTASSCVDEGIRLAVWVRLR